MGPDYEGLAMTRRVLESAKGLIVHSQFMARELREGGYKGTACHHSARGVDPTR